MKRDGKPLECYIAATTSPFIEPGMIQHKIRQGILLFAIPAYGIQFKCRAGGELNELEIGALLALMRFIRTSLKKQNIEKLKVYSSSIVLVSILMNNNKLKIDPKKLKKLNEYKSIFELNVSYIPIQKNRAYVSPVDYPSVPDNILATVKLDVDLSNKIRFKSIQTGVDL